jgi:hypothetical protein
MVLVKHIASVTFEVALGHDAERADCRQCAAVLAIQLVQMIAVDDEFSRLAARQIKVVHQPIARVVVGSVTLVVHARTPVVAFARVVPSGVVHKPSWCCCCCAKCVKASEQELRGAIQASRGRPDRRPQRPRRGRDGNSGSEP